MNLQITDILESIRDAFYAVDGNWRLTYINHQAEQVWGMHRDALIGKNLWDAFPHSVGGRIHQELLRAFQERRSIEFEVLSPLLSRWLEVNIYPCQAGGLSVYFRDISARKAAEEERYYFLREAQSRAAELTAVMEAIPDALFIGNSALVTLVNAPALELLGCTSTQQLNQDLPAVLRRARPRDAGTGEVLPLRRLPFHRTLKEDQPCVQDVLVCHARRGSCDVLLRCAAAPVRVEGQIIGVVVACVDLTGTGQRALLRGLLEAQEAERQAVARELHDGLTQYVMAAHAHLEAFRWLREEAGHETADSQEETQEAAWELEQGLARLQHAMVEARRLVSGLRALALDDLGLAGALEQLVAEEKERSGWEEAELIHNVTGWRFENALETAVYRVAQEALSNARKHGQTSRVQVLLLLAGRERGRQGEGAAEATAPPATVAAGEELSLTLEVRDWGRGFAPETAAAAAAGGHVGLQTMSERVRLAGGSFHLHSAPGQGTTVRAVFPIAGAADAIPRSLADPYQDGQHPEAGVQKRRFRS